jgi:hypothetical protein
MNFFPHMTHSLVSKKKAHISSIINMEFMGGSFFFLTNPHISFSFLQKAVSTSFTHAGRTFA